MKTVLIFWLGILGSIGAPAQKSGKSGDRRVAVCMDPDGDLVVHRAKVTASEMFAAIGVRIDWGSGPACSAGRDQVVFIRLTTGRPAGEFPGALGMTHPFEGVHIEVFYDRVERSIERRAVPNLLAHVIAHEIAHALEGVARHAKSGVMKAQWDGADYTHMKWKPLAFSAEDILLIRCGVDKRQGRPCSATP